MKSKYLLFTGIIYIILTGGCHYNQYSYINHLPHDPAFEKGGELTGGLSTGVYGANVQAAVSPVKYLGITGGYTRDIGAGYGYNYGALLYTPVIKKANSGMYFSFHFERAHGYFAEKITANYTSINLRPSVYGSFSSEKSVLKTGLTAQFTDARYPRLFVDRTVESVFNPGTTTTEVLSDARNVNFTGNGLYGFIEYQSKKSGFGTALYLGAMPHRHNFWHTGSGPVQDKTYQFSKTFFFMWSLKYRLQLY